MGRLLILNIEERRIIVGLLTRLLTKNRTAVPLYYVLFDYNKFKENGKIGSCESVLHPVLTNDDTLQKMINDTIDYIRDNYDMKKVI